MVTGKLFRMSGGIVAAGLAFVSALAEAAMLRRKKVRFAIGQLVVVLMVAVAAQAAFAAVTTCTWNVGSGNWETTGNWNPTGPSAWNSLSTSSGTAAYFNTASVTATLTQSDSATSIFFGGSAGGTTIAANSGGTLVLGSGNDLIAGSLTAGSVSISAPISMTAGAPTWYGPTSSGTLVIAGPATTNQNFILDSGNLAITTGTISVTGDHYLILNHDNGIATTVLQTGGLVADTRTGNNGIYLTQNAGGCTYTISGGSLMYNYVGSTPVRGIAVGYNNGGNGTLNIQGTAYVKTPALIVVASTGTAKTGIINMVGGLLVTDEIYDQNTVGTINYGTFNFSGGTIQPWDGGAICGTGYNSLPGDYIGFSNPNYNINMPITGNGATIDTTDSSGAAQTVTLYANTSGTGSLTAIGAGTLIISGTNTGNYGGQLNVSSGTVRVATNNSTTNVITSGNLNVNGGVFNVFGGVPSVGMVTMASGSIIDSAGGGVLSGTGANSVLSATGPGVAVLAASSNFAGGTTISSGTLQLGDGSSHNGYVSAAAGISNSGVLAFANYTAQTYSGVISGNGSVTVAGPGALTLTNTSNTYSNGTTITGGTLQLGDGVANNGYVPGNIANNAALVFANPSPSTFSGVISGNGSVTVGAGTLAVGLGGLLGTGSITVNPGKLLDLSAFGAGYNLTGGTITAGRASSAGTDINGSLNINNATLGVVGPAASGTLTIAGGLGMSGGTLSFVGGDQVALSGGSLALAGADYVVPTGQLTGGSAGTVYTVFTYPNGSPTPNLANLHAGGFYGTEVRQTYIFGTSGGTAVTLTVTGVAGNLQWNSAASTWDTGITPSWYNTVALSPDAFQSGDNVTFNDRPGGSSAAVNINGSVTPNSLIVSNTAVAYTFSGSGSIGGTTSLVMNGPGALTVNTSNSYTGGTFLNGGLLNLGNSAALGSGALTISGGSVDNTSGAAMTLAGSLAQNWNSSFTFVGGKPLNLGNGPVTLGISPTITMGGSTLTVGGNISGGGYGLTLAGPGMLVLAGTNSYTGGTTISQGTLQLASAAAIPSGANTGNLVFSNAAASAVLDLNGNNATFNALTQSSYSATNLVINSLSGGTATLTVGSNNATTTFGGVLADNAGSGGVLALTKVGAGSLTLINSNTYTGATTISAGTLQLGTGVAGQDSALATTSIVNSGTLIVRNVGPTTLAGPISGAGNLFQNSPSTLTLTGANTLSALAMTNGGTVTGGTIALASGATLVNSAPGLTTLASPLNINSGGQASTWTDGSGTLNIAAPVTNNQGHLFLNGNYTLNSPGSITVSGFALVLNDNTGPGSFQQNGGVISVSRANSNAVYLNQGGNADASYYTISGGSLLLPSASSSLCIGYGAGNGGIMTINGSGVVVQTPKLNLNAGASVCSGAINLENGVLQTDQVFQTNPSNVSFNLSGGTLQPLGAGVASNGWGSSTGANNVSLTISGAGAVMSSNDASGTGRTVPVYASLLGGGTLSTAGAGTIVLQGANSSFTGLLNVAAGTLQVGAAGTNALGGNPGAGVQVSGGVLDINGNISANPSQVTLASGSIVDSAGGGYLNAVSYTVQSGTVSAVLGGVSAPLHKTTSGLVLLTAANIYGGATTINGGTLALSSTATLGNGNGNVTVAPGAVLDISAWNPAGGYNFNSMTLTAGRTSSYATDINGSVNASNVTISPTAHGTMTIAGSLNLNSNVTYSYVPGDLIAVGGALSLNYPDYLLPSVTLSSGTYTLITYNGGSPDPNSDFSMGGSYQSGTRQTYTFGASGGTAVTLVVAGVTGNLFWNTSSGTWDVQNTPSWYNASTGSADIFYAGDNVTFNDRPGGAAATVNVNADVEPASMTVSNTAVSYTMNGTGGINGSTSLVKNGPGILTINTANGYSGGTFLNAGRMNLGNASAIGIGALTIGGGSLDNTSGAAMTLASNNAQNWNGSFTFVGSSPLNLGTGPVTLGATPAVTVNSGTLTVGGGISGGYGLTLAGSGILVLGAPNSYTGDTTISKGVLQLGAANVLPNGLGAGNVVFGNAANSAVLDLNGNDTTVNGLWQPSPSTTNLVVDDATGASNTLSVGNNNVSSTFGGILADNNVAGGGQLNVQKIGTGMLTLIGSNTYSGATTVSGGTLQLGNGSAGHDGAINQTSSVASNATLIFDDFSPQLLAASISGSGTIVQLGPGAVTLSGSATANTIVQSSAGALTLAGGASANLLAIAGNGAVNGGTLTLQNPANNALNYYLALTNTATGTTTLGAAINMQRGREDWTGDSGTLNIAGPITQSSGHFFIDNGNYTLSNGGAIYVNGYALVLSNSLGGVTNFLQTGGSINAYRVDWTHSSLYLTQAGTANYTMTGGTVQIPYLTHLAEGNGCVGNLTINGPAAVFQGTGIDLNENTGGSGVINLVNGALQTDDLFLSTAAQGYGEFNFSGGTLQPIDNGSANTNGNFLAFGNPSPTFNFTITLSGSAATISSTDASGNPQIVPVYTVLAGTGGVNLAGAGTIVLNGSNIFSGGALVANGGTVQVGNNAAFGTGTVNVEGSVDLAGFSPTIGGLSGAAGALIANLSGTNNSTLTVSQSGTDTYAGTIADGPTNTTALKLTGPGTLYLTGTNTYTGGTTVAGDSTLIVTSPLAIDASGVGTNLYVGTDLGLFGTIQPAAQSAVAPAGGPAAVPEPGTLALLAAGAAATAMAVRRGRRFRTLRKR